VKGFKVAEARARFGALLDQAEQGDDVLIERNGVRFRLRLDRSVATEAPPAPFFASVDSKVLAGEWTWVWSPRGLQFQTRRRRRWSFSTPTR
jgi:hypothetical protein